MRSPAQTGVLDDTLKQHVQAAYLQLPLRFEPNRGQADASVTFLSHGSGYDVFLRPSEVVFVQHPQVGAYLSEDVHMGSRVLRFQFVGAHSHPTVEALDVLPGAVHYFRGNDPRQWRKNIPTSSKVRYHELYPGVDLIVYGAQRDVEYDFVLAPGADPSAIRFSVEGASRISIAPTGDLILQTPTGVLRQRKPVIYQEHGGIRQAVEGRYVQVNRRQIGFQIGRYDLNSPLVIDPVLLYSTYLGGSGIDQAFAIAMDAAGAVYVTGQTTSSNFPTNNALEETLNGYWDVFVAKFDPTQTGTASLVYSTYIGGSSPGEFDGEYGHGIAVDADGAVYITGATTSTDFPLVQPFQHSLGGSRDAFVAKLGQGGSNLVYSSYLGGSGDDSSLAIAVDQGGTAYVVGSTASSDFPATPGAIQPKHHGDVDAFVAKISATGSNIVYASYLGGTDADFGTGVALGPHGHIYVAGDTYSSDFPTQAPVQGTLRGPQDVFVSEVNADGSALLFSTYLGGSNADDNFGGAVASDSAGYVYLSGFTESPDFPTVTPFQSTLKGVRDAFVAKLDPTSSRLMYATYLGGTGEDQGARMAVDQAGQAYLTGYTTSTDFPVAQAVQPSADAGPYHAFVTHFDARGSSLIYSTYLGGSADDYGFGIAVDAAGRADITGSTDSSNFPLAHPFQAVSAGASEVFVSQLDRPAHTMPPSIPTGVSAVAISEFQVQLSWAPSTDDVGVAGYSIYRDGVEVAKSLTPSYVDTGLVPATTYLYTVVAYDGDNNFSGVSSPMSATTKPQQDTSPPVISTIGASNVTATSAIVSWMTNEPSTSQVEYGRTTAYGSFTTLDPVLATSHAQTLSELSPHTIYHYKVRSGDATGNLTISNDHTFKTKPHLRHRLLPQAP